MAIKSNNVIFYISCGCWACGDTVLFMLEGWFDYWLWDFSHDLTWFINHFLCFKGVCWLFTVGLFIFCVRCWFRNVYYHIRNASNGVPDLYLFNFPSILSFSWRGKVEKLAHVLETLKELDLDGGYWLNVDLNLCQKHASNFKFLKLLFR